MKFAFVIFYQALLKSVVWTLTRLIDAYAITLGPHLGGRCRFTPSCSHYAREAIEANGVIKGIGLSVRRLAKCGPWHKGGYDPPPVSTPEQ